MSTSTFAGLAGLLVALFLWLRKSKASTGSLPPGPKPLPLVGNIKDLTTKELWLLATRWSKQYGDVVYLHVFGQGLVFLNSPEAASDLMDKRGSIYSDRPPSVMAGELCNCKNMVGFMRYGDQLTRQRKIMHKALGAPAISTYHPLITIETSAFLRRLIADPSNYMKITRRYSGGIILLLTYGYEAISENDEFLKQGQDSLDLLANEVASCCFKHKAAKWRAQLEEFVDKPYEYVKNVMKSGDYNPSFTAMMLEEREGDVSPEFEFDLKWTGNSMYGGGLDTVGILSARNGQAVTIYRCSPLLLLFLLIIMEYPEVLEKAQREIDTIVGSDRLPTFEDRPRLPYVEAILQELWRWSVPVPLGLPHRLMEDDVYKGMHIPKGSLIFCNLWAMTRDENIYSEPVQIRSRTQCPGMHLADSSVWLLIVCMMATLNIKKLLDENGKVIEPNYTFDNSIFRTPSSFQCDIRPRSEKALVLIKQSEVI
ncbi:cytochrome P450 [Amanita rubescens]|nr:cytochrome P450 [Amanita rubescens]